MKNIKEKLETTKAEIKKVIDELNNVQTQINEANKEQMTRKEMLIKLTGKQESYEELLKEDSKPDKVSK